MLLAVGHKRSPGQHARRSLVRTAITQPLARTAHKARSWKCWLTAASVLGIEIASDSPAAGSPRPHKPHNAAIATLSRGEQVRTMALLCGLFVDRSATRGALARRRFSFRRH